MNTYRFGYGTDRLTVPEMMERQTWARLDPEFRRRLVALFDAARDAKTDVGIGGGFRSSQAQTNLFLSRYDAVASRPFDVRWDGKMWRKKPGVASAAPPGRSYHEETTAEGAALAADLVGDLQWMNDNCDIFGLVHFANVNGEPWHVQPKEVARSRAAYDNRPLQIWYLPDISESVEMIVLDYKPGTPQWVATIWTGSNLNWLADGHADTVTRAAGVKRVTVVKDQFAGIIRSSETGAAVPPGMDRDLISLWKASQVK